VGNDGLNKYDFLGMLSQAQQQLIAAAKAAAAAAVPGSEFASALEVFNGCNSLGLLNAAVQQAWKACICEKGFNDPDCEELQATASWLTSIWNSNCQ
jgi:hypothetical protein